MCQHVSLLALGPVNSPIVTILATDSRLFRCCHCSSHTHTHAARRCRRTTCWAWRFGGPSSSEPTSGRPAWASNAPSSSCGEREPWQNKSRGGGSLDVALLCTPPPHAALVFLTPSLLSTQRQRDHHAGPHAGQLPGAAGAGVRAVPRPPLQSAAQVSCPCLPCLPCLELLPPGARRACLPADRCVPAAAASLAPRRKRHTVQKSMVEALSRLMRPGTRVFLQSDVLHVRLRPGCRLCFCLHAILPA